MVAIGAFSFLILIAVTGLVLNHADDLGLPQQTISGEMAKHLYGVAAAPIDAAFEAADIVFVTVADSLYADAVPIADAAGEIRGAVASNDMIVVATDREIILTTADAVLIERSEIEAAQQLLRIGFAGSQVVVDLGDGHFAFNTNQMRLTALESAPANTSWSETIQLENEQIDRISSATLSRVISWERLLSDLHSGRILPGVGRYLFDLTALCLLYLCMSGVLLWFRRR